MVRYVWLAVFVVACGCDQLPGTKPQAAAPPAVPMPQAVAAPIAATPEAPEEFEGMVELFGQQLRARRQVKLTDEGDYVNHGHATAWYESGQKAGHMNFHLGQPHGEQRAWHLNGRKKLLGEWNHGQAAGKWTEWHENGEPSSEGAFVDGKKDGTWTYWDESGEVIEVVEYSLGNRRPVARRSSTTTR